MKPKSIILLTFLLITAGITQISCGELAPKKEVENAKMKYHYTSFLPSLLDEIAQEKTSISAAFSELNDYATNEKCKKLVDALIEAKKRGVDVKIVGDHENKTDSGFVELEKNHIDVHYVDGELKYLKDPNFVPLLPKGYMIREGKLNEMTHNFVLLGKTKVFYNTVSFASQNTAHIGYEAISEYLSEDFHREFKQLYNGVSAISIDVYSGPTKSSVAKHPYETPDGEPFFYSDSLYSDLGRTKILFSPQDGFVKTIIDEVYRAKSSVFIQSDQISDPNLIKALKYKSDRNFDVRIIVAQNNPVEYEKELNSLNAKFVPLGTGNINHLTTIAIFDSEPDRKNQEKRYPRTSLVFSMPIYSAAPFKVIKNSSSTYSIVQYKSDFFSDGHGWMSTEVGSQIGELEAISKLKDIFITNWK